MRSSQGVIAVVEDDFGMREALTRMLKAAGFEARAYGSAEAFLECGSFADLRCLIVDIHLPGASGIDLQRRLAEGGEARPVVFITAHDSPRLRREAEELGAVAFLAKPFEGRLLLGAVREALGQRLN
jgi:FixJ family two-component response regulator